MNTHICANCGADDGLHHFETMQCPKNGIEEYREGKKQEWQNTFFEDKGIKDYETKAIAEYDKLKEDNAALLDALKDTQKIIEYKINSTPTGSFRNELTDLNIKALSAIQKAESK